MRQVIDERGGSAGLSDVPGGTTGLLVKDYKGKDADQPVHKVDTSLLAELRAHEKQAAEELGQWSEKRELTGDALQNELTIVQPLWTLTGVRLRGWDHTVTGRPVSLQRIVECK